VNEEDSNNWGLDSFGALGELSLFEMSFLIGEWLVEWADFLLFLFISPFFSLTTAHILSLGSLSRAEAFKHVRRLSLNLWHLCFLRTICLDLSRRNGSSGVVNFLKHLSDFILSHTVFSDVTLVTSDARIRVSDDDRPDSFTHFNDA